MKCQRSIAGLSMDPHPQVLTQHGPEFETDLLLTCVIKAATPPIYILLCRVCHQLYQIPFSSPSYPSLKHLTPKSGLPWPETQLQWRSVFSRGQSRAGCAPVPVGEAPRGARPAVLSAPSRKAPRQGKAGASSREARFNF